MNPVELRMKSQARSSQPGATSLELLPPEILLPIATNLRSLEELWNLLRASPHAWRLFNSHALVIIEGILSGPNSILPPKVRELIRGVILVRSKFLPFGNLDEFQTRFMRGMLPKAVHKDIVPKTLGPETLSASAATVTVLRSVVATAYQISDLSQSCLASCLARIRAPSFRPLHALNPTPHYTHGYGPDDEWVPPWDRVFIGTPVEVIDLGLPTWVEEMRVVRAMWIIQLMGEVQYLAANGADTIGWPDEDIDTLRKMDPVDLFYQPDCLVHRGEEVKSAMHYLETRGSATKDVFYRLPRPPPSSASTRWITGRPKPKVRTLVLGGYRLDNKFHYLRLGSPPSAIPVGGVPVRLPTRQEHDEWQQTEDALGKQPYGLHFFAMVKSHSHPDGRIVDIRSPIAGVEFDYFRPLGFAFWDRRRMHLLGLVPGLNPPNHNDGFYFFAWESILPPEEVASVKAALREGSENRRS